MKELLLLFLVPFAFVACDDDEMSSGCTQEFVSITFTLEGSPAPDTVVARADGQGEAMLTPANGRYTLVDDSERAALEDDQREYTVEGTNGGDLLFSEQITVTADACHVMRVSGPEVISY